MHVEPSNSTHFALFLQVKDIMIGYGLSPIQIQMQFWSASQWLNQTALKMLQNR